jgi:septal ring factor EnvC (AmiA/AmiB activator)
MFDGVEFWAQRTLSPLDGRTELEADNHRQRQRIAQLDAEVRELAETLDAARAMNRELMTEINRQTGDGGAGSRTRRHS